MTEAQLKTLGVEQREVHWTCECGRTGMVLTRQSALAPLVRLARADHDKRFAKVCMDVDITSVETLEERAQKERNRRSNFNKLGEGFC